MATQVAGVALVGVWAGTLFLAGCTTPPAPSQDKVTTSQHSDASFQKVRQEEQQRKQSEQSQLKLPDAQVPEPQPRPQPSNDQYLTATGYGDLSKGPLICQRVADTAARAELAKLIRVYVEEHTVDRLRERSGSPAQQDIEVVREEWAGELLQDVKIIDRRTNQAVSMCSSTIPKAGSFLDFVL